MEEGAGRMRLYILLVFTMAKFLERNCIRWG